MKWNARPALSSESPATTDRGPCARARLPRLAQPREELAIRGVVVLGLSPDLPGHQSLGLARLRLLSSFQSCPYRDGFGPSPAVLRPLGPGLERGVVILDHLLAGQL